MTKAILGFAVFVLSVLCVSGDAESGVIMLQGSAAVDGADPCANRGNYEMYYDVDHPFGTAFACIDGGTLEGTFTGAAPSNDQNRTTDGAYSVLTGSADEYVIFARGDRISSSAGYMKIWFYPTAIDQDMTFFEMYVDANNKIFLYWDIAPSNAFWLIHQGQGTYHYSTVGSGGVTANMWNSVEARWSVADSDLDIRTNGGTWEHDEDAIAAFATEATNIEFGEHNSTFAGTADVYLDDVYISATFTPD